MLVSERLSDFATVVPPLFVQLVNLVASRPTILRYGDRRVLDSYGDSYGCGFTSTTCMHIHKTRSISTLCSRP